MLSVRVFCPMLKGGSDPLQVRRWSPPSARLTFARSPVILTNASAGAEASRVWVHTNHLHRVLKASCVTESNPMNNSGWSIEGTHQRR